MLAIKLKPTGKKHQRYFRIVVAEKKSKLQGRFLDDLGWLNPHTDTQNINKEKVAKWLKNGAQPTDTVHNLLVKMQIIQKKKRHVSSRKKTEESK